MGGMSAQIPIKDDPKANEIAMAKVRADKLREVTAGHDGTWIAHPLINKIALDVFNEHMLGPNQASYTSISAYSPPIYLYPYFSITSAAKKSRLRPPTFSTPKYRARSQTKVSARMSTPPSPTLPPGSAAMGVSP